MESSASLYSRSIQAHHVCLLVKQLVSQHVCLSVCAVTALTLLLLHHYHYYWPCFPDLFQSHKREPLELISSCQISCQQYRNCTADGLVGWLVGWGFMALSHKHGDIVPIRTVLIELWCMYALLLITHKHYNVTNKCCFTKILQCCCESCVSVFFAFVHINFHQSI